MSAPRLRVVKVGGSLLQYPPLGTALDAWLRREPPAESVLLAGGGPLADWVRETDARYGLGEEEAHWMAIQAMSVTAAVLARILPDSRLVADWPALRQRLSQRALSAASPSTALPRPVPAEIHRVQPASSSAPPAIPPAQYARWVLDARDFLERYEAACPGTPIEASWSVTSDSIAARLAEVLGADELVLMKSAAPPATQWEPLRRCGYVDAAFPHHAATLPAVRFVNLRAV